MKFPILTLALLAGSLLASAQTKRQHYSQSIHDDGKTMSITIDGDVAGGKTINYNRTFNITGMTKVQKDALAKHITDSLGVATVGQPNTPKAPLPPPVDARNENASTGNHYDSDIHDDGKIMRVKISANTSPKSINYQRNINVAGMSKAEKNAILKHITDSLGISKHVSLGTN